MLFKFLTKRPGKLCYKRESDRGAYKQFAKTLLKSRLEKRRKLADPVSASNELAVSDELGFRILDPISASRLLSIEPLIKRCEELVRGDLNSQSKGKAYLKSFDVSSKLTTVPEIMNFALHPLLLRTITDYLGELPVLSDIKLLHSVPGAGDFSGSQLYHCDHDDTRQVKVFLHISDVDEQSGPLTILPANLSEKIRTKVSYLFGGGEGHIPDSQFRNSEVDEAEVSILGPKGTLALVDTARVFHFGSRVSSKERLIFYLHYVTPSSFKYHPALPFIPGLLRKRIGDYPYSTFKGTALSKMQRAVLNGK